MRLASSFVSNFAAERRDLYVLDDCVFVLAPFPKFGLRLMHAATTCGSSGGKGLVARSRCGVPTIIGWTQSTAIPAPILAPLGTKPARAHVALIWAQGFQGTG